MEIVNPFSKGIINNFLDKTFKYNNLYNYLLALLLSLVIFYFPIHLLHLLQFKNFNLQNKSLFSLLDIGGLSQTVFALPLYISYRKLIMNNWIEVISMFTKKMDTKDFKKMNQRINKLYSYFDSSTFDIVIFCCAFIFSIIGLNTEFHNNMNTWYLINDGVFHYVTFCGYYTWFISIIFYMIILMYWFKYLFLWIFVIYEISNNNYKINPLIIDDYFGLSPIKEIIKKFVNLYGILMIASIITTLYKYIIQDYSSTPIEIYFVIAFFFFAIFIFSFPYINLIKKNILSKKSVLNTIYNKTNITIKNNRERYLPYLEIKKYINNLSPYPYNKINIIPFFYN